MPSEKSTQIYSSEIMCECENCIHYAECELAYGSHNEYVPDATARIIDNNVRIICNNYRPAPDPA